MVPRTACKWERQGDRLLLGQPTDLSFQLNRDGAAGRSVHARVGRTADGSRRIRSRRYIVVHLARSKAASGSAAQVTLLAGVVRVPGPGQPSPAPQVPHRWSDDTRRTQRSVEGKSGVAPILSIGVPSPRRGWQPRCASERRRAVVVWRGRAPAILAMRASLRRSR